MIWEAVSIDVWIKVRAAQLQFLVDQGIAEDFAEKLVEDRITSVSSTIPCLRHLSDYLKQPHPANLQQIPYFLVKNWFADLRRHHADDQRWPEWFKVELTNWIHQQDVPSEIKSLPDVGFSRKAKLTDLTESLPELRFAVRVLSDFDRDAWYEPTYALMLSNFLLESE